MTIHIEACNESIRQIAHWFESTYADKRGCPYYWIDGLTGKPRDDRTLLPELDDYAPLLYMVGRHEFAHRQVDLLKERFKKNPLLFSHPQIRRHKGFGLPRRIRRWIPHTDSQDHVEILYGLMELSGLAENPEYLDLARNILDVLIRYFGGKTFFRSLRMLPIGPVLPFAEAMSGMYLEILADMAGMTGETGYFDMAERWGRSWTGSDSFIRYGIFQSVMIEKSWRWIPVFRRIASRMELAKANTAMASGLFAMAAPPFSCGWALDALFKWVEGLRKYFLIPGKGLAHTPSIGSGREHGPILSTNFAVMDILCDLYHLKRREQDIEFAMQLADSFLRHQSGATGLFPDELEGRISYIDANTDLAVTCLKISELTGRNIYREAGERAVAGLLRYHAGPWGYYRDVGLDDGKIVDPLVETRFVSLLLKPLILLRENVPIYAQRNSWSKFRDR
ncbi:hypothetical protein JXA40_10530 [bacterium]|nr:hypothetical protein [candidate division CSSED10-310 bacterium]